MTHRINIFQTINVGCYKSTHKRSLLVFQYSSRCFNLTDMNSLFMGFKFNNATIRKFPPVTLYAVSK